MGSIISLVRIPPDSPDPNHRVRHNGIPIRGESSGRTGYQFRQNRVPTRGESSGRTGYQARHSSVTGSGESSRRTSYQVRQDGKPISGESPANRVTGSGESTGRTGNRLNGVQQGNVNQAYDYHWERKIEQQSSHTTWI